MRRIAAIALCLFAPLAQAIGVRTHAEMAERGLDDYLDAPDAMLPGLNAFLADPQVRRALYSGCTFPDWGYNGINQDAAEDSHWFPFHSAYAELLRERYPLPWSPEAQREVAFFLGLVSHSITDLPWHFGDGRHRSFIQAATAGDGSGHLDCDIGSDIFTAPLHDIEPPMSLDDFFYPIDTVYAAYERFGKTVSRVQLETGTKRERAVWITGEHAAGLLLASQKAKSPWVFAHMEDYYFGGTRHNAAATVHWCRHYYAWFHGWGFFQNSAEYANHPPGYVPYLGTSDTAVFEARPVHNAGGEPLLTLAGAGGNDRTAALIRFDFASRALPPTAGRAALWLRLPPQAGPARTIGAYRCTAAWSAGAQTTNAANGTDGAPASPGETAWSGLPAADADPLSISPAASDPAAGVWVAWDVTAAVQQWLADPASNFGILLRETGDAPTGAAPLRAFASEAWRVRADGFGGGERIAWRPVLVIMP